MAYFKLCHCFSVTMSKNFDFGIIATDYDNLIYDITNQNTDNGNQNFPPFSLSEK